jgi:azurin
MPASWNGQVDQTVTIRTEPGLRFDLSEVRVEAGDRVRLVLVNADDMLHNLVVVRPGTVDGVVQAAMNLGLSGTDLHYVPDSADVLYHTALLQPNSEEAIYFQAPSAPGAYTYVCTFPGHGITMRGTLIVEP